MKFQQHEQQIQNSRDVEIIFTCQQEAFNCRIIVK